MTYAIQGSLLSQQYASSKLLQAFDGRLGEGTRERARRQLGHVWARTIATLGPASSVRAIADRSFSPLANALGFSVQPRTAGAADDLYLTSLLTPSAAVAAVVTLWRTSLDTSWMTAVRHAIAMDARWCICFNGAQLRIIDAHRTYARHYVQFDLSATLADEIALATFWGLVRAEAFEATTAGRCLFDDVLAASARHTAGVCLALEGGVRDALGELLHGLIGSRRRKGRPGATTLAEAFEQSLTLVYRVLFLLFAEARGLVPIWHPVYRDNYTIGSLATAIARNPRARGLWDALQAISRLAHAGCEAGTLRVTAFNGRLFAPGRTPLAETRRVSDDGMARALRALTTRPFNETQGARRPVQGRPTIAANMVREAIAYADLGVEQLGSVYEGVLEFSPVWRTRACPEQDRRAPHVELERGSERRKSTGTFYTPRAMTDFLVRRTLTPLVAEASPEAILELRVLDPAMGSGAFLVSACRYLASAYESALVRTGASGASDVSEQDRASFRRTIAQRCLFGVDLNPMAVQLARLSLWLATLAADRPLTFLDHHLRIGNSLVGASLDDLARQPPPDGARRHPRGGNAPLPLFDADSFHGAMRGILPVRARLAVEPDDSPAAVREKEAALARLLSPASPLARWREVADLWCACWLWPSGDPAAPSRTAFAALTDAVLTDRGSLPDRLTAAWLARARETASHARFFHWTLEFPEVFFTGDGTPRANPGFDAVLGNPPWDMLRADNERDDRSHVGQVVRFARDSGIYRASHEGHANCYQLFIERALLLARDGGRIGLVVPSGLATDHGSAGLRRMLLERCDTEALVGFENRAGIFPIHRSTKFLLMTTTRGAVTRHLHCRFGVRDPSMLDAVPDRGAPADWFPLTLTPQFLRAVSGERLAIPELRDRRDVTIVARLVRSFPALESADGWRVRFGRELNASDDRRHFVAPGRGLPVLEGKQIRPFAVDLAASRAAIAPALAARLLDASRTFARPRLAYRDVASATNRQTLIAALVPAHAVTTHTLFCLKTDLDLDAQWFLCAVLNSFVANYLIRPQVTTHVTVGIVGRLPVPVLRRDSFLFQELVSLAQRLSTAPPDVPTVAARLQALVAVMYGLSREEFVDVLETFPLVDEAEKQSALHSFERL